MNTRGEVIGLKDVRKSFARMSPGLDLRSVPAIY